MHSLPVSNAARGSLCIVTGELAGPDFNGGIGTTNRALALVLGRKGHAVDVLYTQVSEGRPFSARGAFSDHVNAYRKLGINLSHIHHQGAWNDWSAKSYLTLQHLLQHRYDLVFFDDTHGTAYYPLLARRTGNADLRRTMMCVTAHSATEWIADLSQNPIASLEELRLSEMERRSIELADTVKAPSAYILRKYRSYGWVIPDNVVVLPNFTSTGPLAAPPTSREGIDEIVFFGRLESRKGLWMFCHALDRMKYKLTDRQVTFLGKPTVENGMPTDEAVLRRSAGWPFPIRLLNDFDQRQALAYLKDARRLAVIASPEDNSPSAIIECATEGIPFLACSGSGGEELLEYQSRKSNLFPPSVNGLCTKLCDVLEHGASTAQLSFDDARLEAEFSAWLELQLPSRARSSEPAREQKLRPKPILIVIVPPDFNVNQAAVALLRAIEVYGGRVEIEALSAQRDALQKHLLVSNAGLRINASAYADLGKIARSLAYRESTVLGLCHISQLLPPVWVERAWRCFEDDQGISALTGMAERVRDDAPPSHGEVPGHRKISRYLLGNASSLFPLAQETNGGFVLMRSEAAPALDGVSVYDEEYARLKRTEDCIHEIMVKLHLAGRRFEVVPDLAAENPVRETPFEVLRGGSFVRSLTPSLLGYCAGSDQSLLAGLAIDVALERTRARDYGDYLAELAARSGISINRLRELGTPEEQASQLAMVAHTCGQVDLAVDLCIAIAVRDNRFRGVPQADAIKLELGTISLTEAIAAGAYSRLNLDNDFSLEIRAAEREIKLHANAANQGLASLVFPSVDLARIDHFNCMIHTPEDAHPIRFRIELVSADKANVWSAETTVRGGDASLWQVECPVSVRGKCSVLLGVEMAVRQDASKGAFARWVDPRFVRLRP